MKKKTGRRYVQENAKVAVVWHAAGRVMQHDTLKLKTFGSCSDFTRTVRQGLLLVCWLFVCRFGCRFSGGFGCGFGGGRFGGWLGSCGFGGGGWFFGSFWSGRFGGRCFLLKIRVILGFGPPWIDMRIKIC